MKLTIYQQLKSILIYKSCSYVQNVHCFQVLGIINMLYNFQNIWNKMENKKYHTVETFPK